MKTPRALLLARHRPAKAKLDGIRQKILAAHLPSPAKQPAETLRAPFQFRDLLRYLAPLRLHLAGLAATWLLIALIRLSTPTSESVQVVEATPSPEQVLALAEKRRLMAELMDLPMPTAVDRPKSFIPRPRSECPLTVRIA